MVSPEEAKVPALLHAGRRQYLYHPDWRSQRDQQKFDRVREAAARLPRTRAAAALPEALDE